MNIKKLTNEELARKRDESSGWETIEEKIIHMKYCAEIERRIINDPCVEEFFRKGCLGHYGFLTA